MQIPNFSQDQFVNSTALNTAVGYIKNSFETENTSFYTPGLIYSQDLIYTFNNSLTVSLNASSPFAILDANGILSQALGIVNGTTSPIYSLNFAPFVPSSGSVTVYITATTTPIYLQSYQVIGPPVGHPDYNPSFAPYTAYGEAVDSLSITLSTTAPNNQTVFELGRVVLTSGQTAVTSVTTSYQVNCKLYISAIDVQPVKNAIQIGQITSTNQALISGVVPSGVSNNLIQFLVNGSNVFIVDVNGNITSAGNLTVSGSITSGAITTSGLITANNGVTVAGGTLTTPSIAGNPSFTGGLSVPSGQTATVNGTITVPNATAPTQPVALGQQPLLATAYFHAQQQEPSGTQGGSSVAGLNVRILNTVLNNSISGASLASNQITLPAGTYYISATAPQLQGNPSKLSLYNVTSGSYVIVGQNNSAGTSGGILNPMRGIITISTTSVFQLNHYINVASSSNGLGAAVSQSGVVEVYADIEIWQLG